MDAEEGSGTTYLDKATAELGQTDLFFLLVYILGREDIDRDWLYERCREVQASPDGHLDLWAREHYKSTIITFGKTLQDVLIDPNVTIGIFSHTRPIAKDFLKQIKRECEDNEKLKALYPDIFWENPNEAASWSEERLIFKRTTNPKEATIEAWGLVDGMPTSKHFQILVYDDVVTEESVYTPEQIQKTTKAFELSDNLGTVGGRRRMIGTRYHAKDTYATLMERDAFVPRLYPATKDGADPFKNPDAEPVLLPPEELLRKRRVQGPYTFGCFPAGTMVLMSDMSEKPIDEILIGDDVVGIETNPGPRKRRHLRKARVRCINHRRSPVIEFEFESGRKIRCTPDHPFWQGRATRGYGPLGFDKGALSAACSIYDPRLANVDDVPEWARGYLAGMFDGEGSVSAGGPRISQSVIQNPAICQKIRECLKACGLEFSVHEDPTGERGADFIIKGGRAAKIRFCRLVKDGVKGPRVAAAILEAGTRNIGKGNRDKLVAARDLGEMQVYNIETETGNFVAEGYAVKNCQMLQNPSNEDSMGFRRSWMQTAAIEHWKGMHLYLLVDAASSKKKESDFTAMSVIGLGGDRNMYLVDAIRDRLNLTERWEALFELHKHYRPKGVGYERYGKDSDIEHILHMQAEENYRFEITEVGGKMPKEDRIRRLVPWFEQGRFWIAEDIRRRDHEGRMQDITRQFIEDELLMFPVSKHDDLMDAASRIFDIETTFPAAQQSRSRKFLKLIHSDRGSGSWMAA